MAISVFTTVITSGVRRLSSPRRRGSRLSGGMPDPRLRGDDRGEAGDDRGGAFANLGITILVVFLVSALPVTARAQDITSNLIGHWMLDESSGTSAADSSGNSNTGTTQGSPTWFPSGGSVAGALDVNGSSQYVDIPMTAGLDLQGTVVTISAWIKADTTSGTLRRIVSAPRSETGGTEKYALLIDAGTLEFVISTGGIDTGLSTSYTDTSSWHHVAGVYDGATMKIYVDGVEMNSVGKSGNIGDNTDGNLQIGRYGPTYGQYFDGKIDDVRVYGRALNALDVEVLYLGYIADCYNPPGLTGDISYNTDWRTPQYCNGSRWIDMGKKKYTPKAVTFDGSDDYLLRGADLTGNADAKTATGSFWFRRNGGLGSSQHVFANTSGRFIVGFNGVDRFQIEGRNTSNTAILTLTTTNSFTDSNWHHAMFSFDLTDTAKRFIYIDGAAEAFTAANYTNDTIDFTRVEQAVGATTTGTSDLNADIADFWLNSGTYLDLSTTANRQLFYQNGPVYLGSTGSLPTGTAPKVFLSGNTSNWHINDGTGGGFTVTGGLAPITGPAGIVDLTTALDVWWKLDEGSGTVTSDASGNGNNGTLTNGPVWQSTGGKYDGGIELDGTDDYVETDSDSYCATGMKTTVAAWVYPQTLGGVVWWNGDGGVALGNSGGFDFGIEADGSLEAGCYNTASTINIEVATSATGLVPANQWSHVVMTYDTTTSPDTIAIYVDGASKAVTVISNTGGGNPNNGDAYMRIGDCTGFFGTTAGCNGEYFDGIMDDVRVYSRLLSAAEIAALYADSRLCAAPAGAAGQLLYNNDANVMQYCDGAEWKAAGPVPGAGGGGCTNPTRNEGSMVYNADKKVMQYCDGATWVQVGKKWVAPTNGLIGHWKFDETSGTSAADSSGVGHTGTLVGGPTWTTGKVGGALSFDGTNDEVTLASPSTFPAANAAQTLSAWVRSDAWDTDGASFIALWHISGPTQSVVQMGIECCIGDNINTSKYGGTTLVSSGAEIVLGQWILITYTFDGTTHRFYKNGVEVDNSTVAANTATPATASIGYGINSSRYYPGKIDDARIYNRALTATEVQQLYYGTGGN